MRANSRLSLAREGLSRWVGTAWRLGIRPFVSRSLDLLLPPSCAWCGVAGVGSDPLFCADCLRQFTAMLPERRRCEQCAAPLRSVGPVPLPCPYCTRRTYRFERAWVLGDYRGALREAVVKMKQAVHEPLTLQMGRLVGQRLAAEGWAEGCEFVVALPAHWWRRWTRGTSGPELLAEQVARQLQLPLLRRVLHCRRPTKKQGTLSPHQRWLNVHNAFATHRSRALQGARVLLIDDVLTTGATVNEATRALLDGGARQVDIVVVARGLGDTAKS
ncbi:MAG: ComF family protein [Planctomycetota bacterium]